MRGWLQVEVLWDGEVHEVVHLARDGEVGGIRFHRRPGRWEVAALRLPLSTAPTELHGREHPLRVRVVAPPRPLPPPPRQPVDLPGTGFGALGGLLWLLMAAALFPHFEWVTTSVRDTSRFEVLVESPRRVWIPPPVETPIAADPGTRSAWQRKAPDDHDGGVGGPAGPGDEPTAGGRRRRPGCARRRGRPHRRLF